MIRGLFRLLGTVLLLGGLVLLARDLLPVLRGGGFQFEACGALWLAYDATSLQALQRTMPTVLWDHGIAWLLAQPAFVVGFVIGALILLLTRRPSRFQGLR
jgi:hypothetical protein